MEVQKKEEIEVKIVKKPLINFKNLAIYSLTLITALSVAGNIHLSNLNQEKDFLLALESIKWGKIQPHLLSIENELPLYEGLKLKHLDAIAKIKEADLEYIVQHTKFKENLGGGE